MDLICPICSEPWDIDSFHDTPDQLPFKEATRRFRTEGCAVFGAACTPALDPAERGRAAVAGELMDLLGDDVDGVASMLEDFDLIMGGMD